MSGAFGPRRAKDARTPIGGIVRRGVHRHRSGLILRSQGLFGVELSDGGDKSMALCSFPETGRQSRGMPSNGGDTMIRGRGRVFFVAVSIVLGSLCGSKCSATKPVASLSEPAKPVPPLTLDWNRVSYSPESLPVATLSTTVSVTEYAERVELEVSCEGSGHAWPARHTLTKLSPGQPCSVETHLVWPQDAAGQLELRATGFGGGGQRLFQRQWQIPVSTRSGSVNLGSAPAPMASTDEGDVRQVRLAWSLVGGAPETVYLGRTSLAIGVDVPVAALDLDLRPAGRAWLAEGRSERGIQPSVGEIRQLDVNFRIPVGERGEVVASATARDECGSLLFARSNRLYLIADAHRLYHSTSSFTEIEIEKLRADLAAGRISRPAYDAELRRILGGGAAETNG